jgi:hypothetical protein
LISNFPPHNPSDTRALRDRSPVSLTRPLRRCCLGWKCKVQVKTRQALRSLTQPCR